MIQIKIFKFYFLHNRNNTTGTMLSDTDTILSVYCDGGNTILIAFLALYEDSW